MSLYSHETDFRQASTGFPFCRGETRMADPEPRAGSACGVGWTTLGGGPEADAFDGGARSSRCGVGCWILGLGAAGRGWGGRDGPGCAATRSANISSASPYSSSSISDFCAAAGSAGIPPDACRIRTGQRVMKWSTRTRTWIVGVPRRFPGLGACSFGLHPKCNPNNPNDVSAKH